MVPITTYASRYGDLSGVLVGGRTGRCFDSLKPGPPQRVCASCGAVWQPKDRRPRPYCSRGCHRVAQVVRDGRTLRSRYGALSLAPQEIQHAFDVHLASAVRDAFARDTFARDTLARDTLGEGRHPQDVQNGADGRPDLDPALCPLRDRILARVDAALPERACDDQDTWAKNRHAWCAGPGLAPAAPGTV